MSIAIRTRLVALFLALSGFGLWAWAQDDAASPAQEIRQLQAERHGLLAQRVKLLQQGLRNGTVTMEQIAHAQEDLFQAELELQTDDQGRRQVLTQRLENFRMLEQMIERQMAAGTASTDQTLLARSARLAAEIDLLRAGGRAP